MLNCSYSCFGDLKKRFEESESKGANVNELNHQKTDKGTEINTELTAVQKINLLKLAKPETNIFERATEVHY